MYARLISFTGADPARREDAIETIRGTVVPMLRQYDGYEGYIALYDGATRRAELKEKFRHHAGETRQQIQNLEQAFRAIGAEVDDKPCPAIEGLEKEGQTLIKQTDEQLVDVVLLGAAAETEHHEIAVYDSLIGQAEALGQ